MSQPKEELLSLFPKRGLLFIGKYLLLALIVIAIGLYIGSLLFGVNSVEVLYNLHLQQKALKRNIQYLKKENAKLQKEYFELKELEGE